MTDKEKIKFWAKGRLFEIMNGIGENDAKNILTDLLSFIDSMQEEPSTSVWHDAKEPPEIHRKYLTRYADGKVNGSWERHDEGFIPWKEVVKEHKFTHWCYVEDLLKL